MQWRGTCFSWRKALSHVLYFMYWISMCIKRAISEEAIGVSNEHRTVALIKTGSLAQLIKDAFCTVADEIYWPREMHHRRFQSHVPRTKD